MKVLHLSEFGLPDWRIEKSAITAKRKIYDVFLQVRRTVRYIIVLFLRNGVYYSSSVTTTIFVEKKRVTELWDNTY